MQENPDGNYYLAKDITIKGNLNLFPNYYDYDTKVQHEECFTGSLDGKGHTIKNYTGMGLFNNAKNATFKNIVMTNVTIQGKEMGAALVYQAEKCRFSNITVSGKATIFVGGFQLPAAWPGVAAATILAFARAMGEFGATIMLAGNIPGKTQTMSVAIYTAVQSGDRSLAYYWVAIIMGISFFTIFLMNYWMGYQERRGGGKR